MGKINTLGKNERLKSRKLIEKLFREGKSFSVFPFRICYSISKRPVIIEHSPFTIQFGVSASSRNFKRAVDRNRIKRLVRECYRLQKKSLYEITAAKELQLSLFFIYTAKELPDYKSLSEKMSVILQRLIKIIDEKNSSNT